METETVSAEELRDEPPRSASLTAYDRTHAATYIRLLDAADADAAWQDVVRIVFKLDPNSDPERLERMHAPTWSARSGCAPTGIWSSRGGSRWRPSQ